MYSYCFLLLNHMSETVRKSICKLWNLSLVSAQKNSCVISLNLVLTVEKIEVEIYFRKI